MGTGSAVTITIDTTGTVYNSTDATGVFGGDPTSPGYHPSYLDGLAYALTYMFDDGDRMAVPGVYDLINY